MGELGRPAVIELVGPAGVGKTTLSQQLEATGQARRGTIWLVPKPVLAYGTIRQLPAALTLYRETGKFLWNEIKHLARLDALYTFLRTTHWNGTRLVALDEGPVYTLSSLQVVGHRRFCYGPSAPFLQQTIQRWVPLLDAVVVLDAPDALLTSRIRSRTKPHLMKQRSALEISAFLEAYRRVTERVLAEFSAAGGPPVVRLDCSDGTERLDERVLEALGRQRRERSPHAH
ncbi:MAG TPA: hypothetical protein VKQ05_03345 [Gemmatimonadales bacterium]|nr:hypothetical protein [Gemmatimonadales bacterium]